MSLFQELVEVPNGAEHGAEQVSALLLWCLTSSKFMHQMVLKMICWYLVISRWLEWLSQERLLEKLGFFAIGLNYSQSGQDPYVSFYG